MIKNKSILVFGGGILQVSIIKLCVKLGVNTIVIDPDKAAIGQEFAHHFYPIGGQDFDGTCEVIERHQIDGIITAATDKPLVMMAKIAEKYNFPYYSEKTAELCTDKFKMKQTFIDHSIPCASGKKIYSPEDNSFFPVIIKPVDNSGSRGVFYCKDKLELEDLFYESMNHTKKDYLLAVEVINGEEYSIEAIHHKGKTNVVQYTHKVTTDFPYNVELSHTAPAKLSGTLKDEIDNLIAQIATAFTLENCVSHTELKINNGVITLIETSPRTGGDYITSDLVPNATGINIEENLIRIALNEELCIDSITNSPSGIFYFLLPQGKIAKIHNLEDILMLEGVTKFSFRLNEGDDIPMIKNSLDRYGFYVIQCKSEQELSELRSNIQEMINERIEIECL
jgi:carbamoyl-phosphate synthase large subunit